MFVSLSSVQPNTVAVINNKPALISDIRVKEHGVEYSVTHSNGDSETLLEWKKPEKKIDVYDWSVKDWEAYLAYN